MSNGSNFVSSYSFALPDEILKQLKASDFISGTTMGPERTKALVEGALDPLAREASRKEAQSRQFALEERGLPVVDDVKTRIIQNNVYFYIPDLRKIA